MSSLSPECCQQLDRLLSSPESSQLDPESALLSLHDLKSDLREMAEHQSDLRYVRRKFIHKEQLRNAVRDIANAIFRTRLTPIWGEATTACASDSKKFGAWDQNLMTEWHTRYGGRGIMVYWHVETKSVCIYSQLKRCSSSEAATMLSEPEWMARMQPEDLRALTPLFYAHVNPYGRFRLDLKERLRIDPSLAMYDATNL